VAWAEVWLTSAGAAAILVLLALTWRPCVAATVDEDLARAEGVPVAALSVFCMLLVAGVVALAMKVVGVLLVTALLVIPAVTARRLARSPEQMAVLAPLFGVASVAAGLILSLYADTPSGPSIVVGAFALFVIINAAAGLRGSA